MHIDKIQAAMFKLWPLEGKEKLRMPGKYMKAIGEGRGQMKMKRKLQDNKRMYKYQCFHNTDINIQFFFLYNEHL